MNLPKLDLISEILGFEVKKIKRLDDIRMLHTEFHGWIVECKDSDNDFLITSLSELAHTSKYYAFDKGYILVSYKEEDGWYCDIEERNTFGNTVSNHFDETEPEVIFKSCEWIWNKLKSV